MTCLNSAPTVSTNRKRCVFHRPSRGFTLTEVIVVIFLIALLAAIASPSFVQVMRDSSMNRMNMEFAELYRRAYIESAAQSTILVRWTGGNAPSIQYITATLDTQEPTLVSPRRCNAINWDDPVHRRQTFSFASSFIPEFATVAFVDNANQERQTADVCYSQRRAQIRFNGGAFVDMPGAARLSVKNMRTNVMRRVLIPAFGLPRLIQ